MFAEMVRNIFDEVPDMVLIVNITTLRICFANQVTCNLTGLSSEQIQTQYLPDLFAEQEPDNAPAKIIRVAAGQIAEFEYEAALNNAHPHATRFALKLSRLVMGQIPYLLCIGRDISERTSQQRESSILYAALVNGLSDLMFRITEDGIYRAFHIPESTGLRQPPPENIIDRRVEEVVPPEVAEVALPAIRETVETGEVQTVEYSIQETDGVRHHYEARFVPSLSGEIVAVVRDITERKKEAETLERSERLIRALLNASPDSAILLDSKGHIQAINQVAAQRFAQTVEQMLGGQIADFIPPDIWAVRLQHGQKMLAQRDTVEFEDARAGFILANRVAPIFDPNGDIVYVAIFSRDITQQRANEHLLERKSALLEAVAAASQRLLMPGDYDQAINDAIAIVGQTVEVDRVYVFESHHDPKTGEALLSERYLWTSPHIPDRCRKPPYVNRPWIKNGLARWHETLSQGGIINERVRELPDRERAILENAGGQLSLLAVPIFVDQVFWGFISFDDCRTGRDWTPDEINTLQTMSASLGSAITRQHTELDLLKERNLAHRLRKLGNALSLTREPRSLLEELLEQIQDVIAYDTASAMLLTGNTAHIVTIKGFEQFGLSLDNLPRSTFSIAEMPYMQRMIQNHQPYVSPSVLNDPTWANLSEVHWIRSWLGAPIVYDDVVRGFFSLDSTEENFYTKEHIPLIQSVALQAAIALKNAEYVTDIKNLEQIKSEIIRIASHDLRNPLSRIREFVTQLHSELMPNLTSKQNEALQHTLAATRDMSHIIDNILSLERIEAQHHAAQPIFWSELIHQAVESVREELLRHAHTLTVHLAPELPVSRGNAFKLERAIHNLLHNAIKYTPPRGQITLRVYLKPYGIQTTVAIEVEDNGIGIPPEQHAQLFEPFYRAQQPGTKNIPGTGLGLSMVKSVIEEHNGSIYFDSVPDQGSLFGFWVPVIGSA